MMIMIIFVDLQQKGAKRGNEQHLQGTHQTQSSKKTKYWHSQRMTVCCEKETKIR